MARARSLNAIGQDEGGDQGSLLKQVNPTGMPQAAQNEAPGFEMPDLGGMGGGQESDIHRRVPITGPESAQSGETGRDRGMLQGGNATLRRPSSPSPMAGSVSPAQAPLPFQPMGSPEGGMMAHPQGLFGSAGGLQGGGLGTTLDPTPNQKSSSIEDLLQMLLGKQGL